MRAYFWNSANGCGNFSGLFTNNAQNKVHIRNTLYKYRPMQYIKCSLN